MNFIRDLISLQGFPTEPLFGPAPVPAPRIRPAAQPTGPQAPVGCRVSGRGEPKPA